MYFEFPGFEWEEIVMFNLISVYTHTDTQAHTQN